MTVYNGAIKARMEIFEMTKKFPQEEKYSLTDQTTKSSHSGFANMIAFWRKPKYNAAFIAKLSNSKTEACEVQAWWKIALLSGIFLKPI